MAGEDPGSLAIEQIWVAECDYGPNVAERRAPVRSRHLVRIGELKAAGVIVDAGAFTDMSGSLILLRAPSEKAARAVLEADVYWQAGVWSGVRIRAFGHVVRQDELGAD
jgi:uncharacterized protein YciI